MFAIIRNGILAAERSRQFNITSLIHLCEMSIGKRIDGLLSLSSCYYTSACTFWRKKIAKMFQKAFKTKNNTQVKSTERKKLRSRVESAFRVSESDLNKLVPTKCTINQLKLITHAGETVTVYTCDRRPMFFEIDSIEPQANALMPTVYSMWILPDLVPSFTTHAAVLPRLASGADLMLPGTSLNSLTCRTDCNVSYGLTIFIVQSFSLYYCVIQESYAKAPAMQRMEHVHGMQLWRSI